MINLADLLTGDGDPASLNGYADPPPRTSGSHGATFMLMVRFPSAR